MGRDWSLGCVLGRWANPRFRTNDDKVDELLAAQLKKQFAAWLGTDPDATAFPALLERITSLGLWQKLPSLTEVDRRFLEALGSHALSHTHSSADRSLQTVAIEAVGAGTKYAERRLSLKVRSPLYVELARVLLPHVLPLDPAIAACLASIGNTKDATLADLQVADPDGLSPLAAHFRLVSHRTGGTVPGYIERDHDSDIDARIQRALESQDPADRLVVLVGEPKVGKTRSAIECLVRKAPDLRLHVVAPATDGRDPLRDYAEALRGVAEFEGDDTVVLVDDLQAYLYNPQDPDRTRGSAIQTHLEVICKRVRAVVATVHPPALVTPAPELFGIDTATQDWLTDHAVALPTEASADEQRRAAEHFGGSPEEWRFLAAELAGVTALLQRIGQALADPTPKGRSRASVIHALQEAELFHTNGVDRQTLRAYALNHWSDLMHAAPLSDARFDEALEWWTTPISIGGWAVATVNRSGEDVRYVLSEAIRSTQLHDVSPHPALTVTPDMAFNAGMRHLSSERAEQAQGWLRRAADGGHAFAMFALGRLLAEQGLLDEAERWVQAAADAGSIPAMARMGASYHLQGRVERAEQMLERAAAAGDVVAISVLADVRADQGRWAEAEELYAEALAKGMTVAMLGMGYLCIDGGRTVEALQWFERAASEGSALAMTALAMTARVSELTDEQGHVEEAEARQWLEQAGGAGVEIAIELLVDLCRRLGDTEEFDRWVAAMAKAHENYSASPVAYVDDQVFSMAQRERSLFERIWARPDGHVVRGRRSRWGGLTPPLAKSPRMFLARGPARFGGRRYAVTLAGFAPGSWVFLTYHDSISPEGFWREGLKVDDFGRADSMGAYSGDGPDHWVRALSGGIKTESNHVTW